MDTKKSPRNIWFYLSLICFLLGIVVWLPNIIFSYGYSYWFWTFIINPIGIVFGIIGKSKFGIISNAIMTFSFIIFMFIGYLIVALFGGKP
ncbi:hypothetical protein [Halalkalibacter lacteus]|uniref:hypothetical protein n=1 Tax=Halalkalibacter lacteus TaxID=3090663 RepID=UPI002FC7D480